MTVHRLLVTAHPDPRVAVWAATAMYANWLECREHPAKDGAETCLVTVFGDQLAEFVDAARRLADTVGPVTVQEIHGAGDEETYTLILGPHGTGWPDQSTRDAVTEHHRRAADTEAATLVDRLAQDLANPDH